MSHDSTKRLEISGFIRDMECHSSRHTEAWIKAFVHQCRKMAELQIQACSAQMYFSSRSKEAVSFNQVTYPAGTVSSFSSCHCPPPSSRPPQALVPGSSQTSPHTPGALPLPKVQPPHGYQPRRKAKPSSPQGGQNQQHSDGFMQNWSHLLQGDL